MRTAVDVSMDVRWVNVSHPPSLTAISSFSGDGREMTAHGRLIGDRASEGDVLPPDVELLPPAEHPASTTDMAVSVMKADLADMTTCLVCGSCGAVSVAARGVAFGTVGYRFHNAPSVVALP
jgi:hypothetical protein